MSGTIVIVIAVVLVVALLVYALVSRGRAAAVAPIHAERRHDWEMQLSAEHEDALLKGLLAWRDAGHDLTVWHEGAKIDVFDPPMVVSLYALTDAFTKRGSSSAEVPKILDEWAARETPGASLHLSREWYAKPVVGDAARFTAMAFDLLQNARAEVEGIAGGSSDELRGEIDVMIRADRLPNTLAIDLSRVVAEIHRRKEEDDRTPLVEMLRDILHSRVSRDGDCALWMRAPTQAEREIALRAIERSTI